MRRRNGRRVFVHALPALTVSLVSSLTLAADAERPSLPRRIGVLLVAWHPTDKQPQQLRTGLREAGYVEGREAERIANRTTYQVRARRQPQGGQDWGW